MNKTEVDRLLAMPYEELAYQMTNGQEGSDNHATRRGVLDARVARATESMAAATENMVAATLKLAWATGALVLVTVVIAGITALK